MRATPRVCLALCLVATMSVCGSADQTPQLSRVMREKLGRSQALLAAVIKSDWAALDRESRALALATKDPSWAVLTSPEYLRQSDAFMSALQNLRQASQRRDLQAAADAHVALTLSCVQCHLHMTRQRMATVGATGAMGATGGTVPPAARYELPATSYESGRPIAAE